MITPQDMTRETREGPDLSVEVRVRLVLEETVKTVPWPDIRAHDLGHVVGEHPVVEAIRRAEDRIMERLYGPAEHLWDVAAGLTAALKCVRKKFLPQYLASSSLTVPKDGPAVLVCPEWPEEYRAFRALLLQSGLELGLRWSSAGDKFVPQTGGEGGPAAPQMRTMEVCPACGNKRCPHASDRQMRCTGSNEVGQVGVKAGGPEQVSFPSPGCGWERRDYPCNLCQNTWTWYRPPYLLDDEQRCPRCGAYRNDLGEWTAHKPTTTTDA